MQLIAVTNRRLCANRQDFLRHIQILSETLRPGDAILLREKDLSLPQYRVLAEECDAICKHGSPRLILHSFPEAAPPLGLREIHLPMPQLKRNKPDDLRCSTSVHSVEEAVLAEQLGAAFVIAGHIFPTDCKKGLQPRGLPFLQSVCEAVSLPVFAIGGITPQVVPSVMEAGAAGICVMSGLMTCDDLPGAITKLKQQ